MSNLKNRQQSESNTTEHCQNCDGEGQFSDKTGAFSCQTAKAGHKPTEDRKGEEQCPAGKYSTGGADECLQCGEGETSSAGAAGCSTCATCATGRYMINACTPTTETLCGDCLAGTASIGGTVTECTPCNVDGKYSISDNASFCLTAKAGYKPTSDRKVRMNLNKTGTGT